MRSFRTVVAGLLAVLLSLGVAAAVPAQADRAQADRAQADRALPKRTITEVPPDENQISFNTFKLNGVVTELQADGATYLPYAKKKVQLQKKACAKSCRWKTTKKVETDENGKYKTKIFAPRTGRWKWRVKVKSSNGFGTTKGKTWTLFFQ